MGAVRAGEHKMFDIVAANEEKFLARTNQQRFDNCKAALRSGAHNAGDTPAARREGGEADKREHKNEGAEVANDVEHFHARNTGGLSLIAR